MIECWIGEAGNQCVSIRCQILSRRGLQTIGRFITHKRVHKRQNVRIGDGLVDIFKALLKPDISQRRVRAIL